MGNREKPEFLTTDFTDDTDGRGKSGKGKIKNEETGRGADAPAYWLGKLCSRDSISGSDNFMAERMAW